MKAKLIFEKYTNNLNLLIDNHLIEQKHHNLKNFYICPICLNKFNKLDGDNPLTLEDAPQKSIGGSKNTLTCKKCNNEAGFKIDHHLVNRLKDLDNKKLLPESEIPIKTKIDDITFNATLKIDKNGISRIYHSKNNNNPKLIEKNIPELKPGKIVDVNFVNKNINPDHLDYAVLKSAYIILFQYTGYKVILTNEYDIIREQIKKPEKRLLPENFYFYSNKPYKNNGVFFVCEKNFECIQVTFTAHTIKSSRNFCVFLPLPNKNYINTLERIFKTKKNKGEIRLNAFPQDIQKVNYLEDIKSIKRLENWFNSF